jgi:hypothetical protein
MFVDGIYPKWKCFAQTISEPRGEKERFYAKMQESVRKDIERSYGVLQKRFAIVRLPARFWYMMRTIMTACLILQNMIIRDKQKRGIYGSREDDCTLAPVHIRDENERPVSRVYRDQERLAQSLHEERESLADRAAYFELRSDLVEHLWSWKGTQNLH